MGWMTSPRMTMRPSCAMSWSSVCVTPPSSAFSMGTSAWATSPDSTASKHAAMLGYGTSAAAASAPTMPMRASSQNVPSGPR